ncbi:hypothetical protein [Spelaeicoccus albus]|uniref:DUF4352 domain-containing protein n=1 Tax=Spelaeicoccus albus TaxID=1280376 RepID=A0A7Z0D5J6_9MICO|nr:hypothetical protein [Spelaeicoccus albus]NYI69295.1 hypothetical protein [Spelaeicoccus albus]
MMCGRLLRVRAGMMIAAALALASCAGGQHANGPETPAGTDTQSGSARGGPTATDTPSGAPTHAANVPDAVRPGTSQTAGKAAVIAAGGSVLRVTITSRKGKRELLLDQPEFGDSRMVPTYVTLTVTNVGKDAARPMAEVMQGFVPEESNGAEMMQTAPLPHFAPCTGHAVPQALKPGRKYVTCRVAVSKRGHPLAKVIFRGQLGGKYYNSPVVWTI